MGAGKIMNEEEADVLKLIGLEDFQEITETLIADGHQNKASELINAIVLYSFGIMKPEFRKTLFQTISETYHAVGTIKFEDEDDFVSYMKEKMQNEI